MFLVLMFAFKKAIIDLLLYRVVVSFVQSLRYLF